MESRGRYRPAMWGCCCQGQRSFLPSRPTGRHGIAGSPQRAEHPAVTRARELARRRAAEGISVSDLACEVGLSLEHLVRLFRRQTGLTPGAVLREERLSHGMHLLQHTGLTVAEVARRSGFVSPHHFARSVRAATGMSPSELRAGSWVGQAWTDPGSA